MALPDLTGQNIEDTYQRVLQIGNGGDLRDGTGSLIPFLALNDVSASDFIIGGRLNIATAATLGSAKIIGNLTVNGDITSNNSHIKVLLPITASSNISASGTITAASFIGTMDGGSF
jgi:hypothetical protein|tara:strand:+ start:372 stop:722 length:351 start_codon:yes stop_codon:yes gene_type:complete